MSDSQNKKNEQQNNLRTTLTEKWKKGELYSGVYYIKYRGAYKIDQWHGYYWEDSWSENIEEVLAPIPSYEEWMRAKYSLDDYKRLCDVRGKIIDKMEESNEDTVKYLRQENAQLHKFLEEFNALDVAEENQQLKELLKECKLQIGNEYITENEIREIYHKIDNAIGEKSNGN